MAGAGGPVLGPSLRDFAGNQKQRDVNMSAYIAYLPYLPGHTGYILLLLTDSHIQERVFKSPHS